MRAALLMASALAASAAASWAAEPPAKIRPDSYGQHLVQRTLATHKDVVVMAMHVTPPGGKQNVIVASNIGRLGKPADADDQQVLSTGEPKLSVNKAGDRFEVLEPLKDVGGETIGVLGVVFNYQPGDDQQARRAQAEAIRDHLARRISHAGNLLDPWPYAPHFGDQTYAQQLVDKTMAVHPDVIILALHATPPGSKTDVILGSNIGRIGKKADEDDMRVVDKGAINKEVNETGKRFEAEVPLNDRHGKRIGALGVVFNYRQGDDKDALTARALKIRDEIAAQIPSPAALVKPAR
jgi:hypothetical protein